MSDWLTYSPISGHRNGIITITADTLSSLEDRVATIIVSNSQYSLSASTSVTQQGSQLTAITFENLIWVTDVPASGGTATKNNCSYTVIGQYANGNTGDITEYVTVSGSLNVAATTTVDRHDAGTLTLSASYSQFTASANVTVYQAAPSITGISFNNLTWVTDIASTGGTATSANCSFNIYAYYTNGGSNYVDVTNASTVSGYVVIPESISENRHSAGTLTLTATYSTLTASSSTTIYQEAAPKYIINITFDNLTWVTDIPASGGTGDSANCSYSIYANHSDGTSVDVTSISTVSGSLTAPSTTVGERQNVGTLTLTAQYLGFTTTGDVIAYQEAYVPTPTPSIPLTFEIISGGDIFWKSNNSEGKTISFSKNDGDWVEITSSKAGTQINVSTGDVIKFKGDNSKYSNSFSSSTGTKFNVKGNIMSLIDSDGFATAKTLESDYTFSYLFSGCTGLVSAENLLLPATTLADYCYSSMFYNCTSLTKAPELPATELDYYCYSYMFQTCTSLTTAPSVLPATTLQPCCYEGMFAGCSSLTTAPQLPAPFLIIGCYRNMFYNCSSLNYIKCLSEPINEYYAENWVYGVSSTGTFVKNPKMVSWTTGPSGIPSGWTVTNAS